MGASPEANKKLIRDYFEAVGSGASDKVVAAFADDVTVLAKSNLETDSFAKAGVKGQVYRFPFRRVNGRRHSINAKR